MTIAAPDRRIDMALPERSPLAEVVPGLLAHAGDGLADAGTEHGGWMLRRTDGAPLDPALSLTAHRVRDGEVLHLVPRRLDWPELEYDDVVDAISAGASRTGSLWGPGHTRRAALAVGGAAVLAALVVALRTGPSWLPLVMAALLLAAGTALARALGDAEAGSAIAIPALPCAAAGGFVLWSGTGAPQVLAGCAALLLAAVLAQLGVVDRGALFTGAAVAGLLGLAGAWLTTTEALGATGVAAIGAGVALVFSPLCTGLSIRLSRVPMPVLPRTPADLVRDDPQPPRPVVYAAVLRADSLLTGLLCGIAAVVVACESLLAFGGDLWALVLLGVVSLGLLLRARLYKAIRHRAPLLVAGVVGVVCLAFRVPLGVWMVPVVLVVGTLAVIAGLVHSRRAPSAFFGRYAEILEIVLVLATVPLVCAVLGLYGLLRGLGG
ncbi:type VII secretion integral membrane protein EccD [Lentzea sp. E54]|uniref:type VII secretion integral membrane protein EccD n=1 Tax=Lentzea xerophila TaxID=3435883 RepID=UPI003DA57F2C